MDGSLIRMMILFCLQTTIRGIVLKNCLYFFGDSHVSRMQKKHLKMQAVQAS